jgi:hypothetical protein
MADLCFQEIVQEGHMNNPIAKNILVLPTHEKDNLAE